MSEFIKYLENYGKYYKPGRKSKLSPSAKRLLLREENKGNYTASQLKKRIKLDVYMSTVKRLLRNNQKIKWNEAKAAPLLTELHQNERLKWTQKHVTFYKEYWKAVLFYDGRSLTWMDRMAFTTIGIIY